MKIVAIAIACCVLCACASTVDLAKIDDAKCKSYGAQPGTPVYAQCRTQMDTTRTTARAIIAASP
jgi:hypothetical protein